MTKNFKHQINSQLVLSELVGLTKKEQLAYLISLHQDLARDSIERATHPIAIEILTETYQFRERAAEAGKKGMEARYKKEMEAEEERKRALIQKVLNQNDGLLD